MERSKEIEKELSKMDTWDMELLKELCTLAGMEKEWEAAEGESFEAVAYAAAEKLGVEIYAARPAGKTKGGILMEKLNGFKFEGNNEYGDYVMTVEVENERIVVMNESHLGNTCVFNESEEKFDGEVQKLWEELQAQNLDDLAAAILRETKKN